jgi:glucokinase
MSGVRASSRDERRGVIGIDLGATKTAAGLVSAEGTVMAFGSWPTRAGDGPGGLLAQLAAVVDDMVAEARALALEVVGVGLATPGIVDAASGVIRYATPALPGWTGLRLSASLAASVALPVVVHNDGQATAQGEWVVGAAAGCTDALVVTVGTGVGGGIIAGGRLLLGHEGSAGRIGHLSVDADGRWCWCGARGCVEQYVSGTAIARDAQTVLAGGVETTLRQLARPVVAADVVAAARAGDGVARSLLVTAGSYLGAALTSLVNVLSPEVVVIAGGLAEAGTLLIEPAEAVLRERLPAVLSSGLAIRLSTLGSRAAVAGAALLAWEQLAG